MPEKLAIFTQRRCEMVDVTAELEGCLSRHEDWRDGFLAVTSPHTTCGVTINEGYDPDVRRDMTGFLAALVPQDENFAHAEGNSDAHIKTAIFGTSELIPVSGGRLDLGQWQAVYLCESDGPRRRTLRVAFIPAL